MAAKLTELKDALCPHETYYCLETPVGETFTAGHFYNTAPYSEGSYRYSLVDDTGEARRHSIAKFLRVDVDEDPDYVLWGYEDDQPEVTPGVEWEVYDPSGLFDKSEYGMGYIPSPFGAAVGSNIFATESLVSTREETHGYFGDTSRVAQRLKQVLFPEDELTGYSDIQAEALHMISSKLSRIVAGDPNFQDHWDDIAGYARIVSKSLGGEDQA